MFDGVLRAGSVLALLIGWPLAALAQFPPPPAPAVDPSAATPQIDKRWPSSPLPSQDLSGPKPTPAGPQSQAQPAEQPDPAPPAIEAPPEPPKPARAEPNPRSKARPAAKAAPKPAPRNRQRAAARGPAGDSVVCSGVFAKDSSHERLAAQLKEAGIAWDAVTAANGGRMNASVLYPGNPARRLEVIWVDDATRSGLQVVAINGQSRWSAPRGLRLGLSLAAVEKVNGRPFRLGPLDGEGTTAAIDWEGGALSRVAGGCRVGVRLTGKTPPADTKPAGPAQAAADGSAAGQGGAAKGLMSNDPALRGAGLTIREILIGY